MFLYNPLILQAIKTINQTEEARVGLAPYECLGGMGSGVVGCLSDKLIANRKVRFRTWIGD